MLSTFNNAHQSRTRGAALLPADALRAGSFSPLRRKRPFVSESSEKSPEPELRIRLKLQLGADSNKLDTNSPGSQRSLTKPRPLSLFAPLLRPQPKSRSAKFNRAQVSGARAICRRCKERLLSGDSQRIFVEMHMFKSTNSAEEPKSQISNRSVFSNSALIKNLILKPQSVAAMRMLDINFAKAFAQSKLQRLKALFAALVKFLLGTPLATSDLESLSATERRLFLLFLAKKKGSEPRQIDAKAVEALSADWLPKRFEENLRFVLNKVFKFLTSIFNQRLFFALEKQMEPWSRELPWKARFAYAFYGYYFGDAARARGKPLEGFFHPKVAKHLRSPLQSCVSKTISQYYLSLLCTSSLFRRDFSIYVRECLEREARHNIVFKAQRLCMDWEKRLASLGSKALVKQVRKQFRKNPKCKTPWGLQEVRAAAQSIMKLVDSQRL